MLIRTLAILTCIFSARAQDAAPAPHLMPSGKVTVTIDGKEKEFDFSDPASMEQLKGKAVVITEINGCREVRVVDRAEMDDLPPLHWLREQPPVRTGPVTYLGLGTVEVPECVAAQLPLERDTGLQVAVVLPDSPAAAAGLQEGDVLQKFEDQILISPRQLAVLIANRKEGDTVKLTLLRKAEALQLTATLGKRDVPCTTETPSPVADVKREILRLEKLNGKPENFKMLLRADSSGTQRAGKSDPQPQPGAALPAVEDTAAAVRRALEKLPVGKRLEMEQFLKESGLLPKGTLQK